PEKLETWFRGSTIDIVAEHGSVFKKAGTDEWIGQQQVKIEWKDEVRQILEKYVQMIPGSFVEEKNYSIAWHYRGTENIDEENLKVNISKELMMLSLNDNFDILQGNKVIEIKSNRTSKGLFVDGIVKKGNYDFVLAIGDD